MPYPYPKYHDEADTEAHIHAFLTTWQSNHVSQRLSEADADKSKIAEFGLSLGGQSANWYSQHEVREFKSFKILSTKLIQESILCHIPRNSRNCSIVHNSVSKVEMTVSKTTSGGGFQEDFSIGTTGATSNNF